MVVSLRQFWQNRNMDALPPHANSNHAPCSGTTAVNISEDVGLLVGGCPECSQTFVYLPNKHTWELEDTFEKSLQSNAISLGPALRRL